MTNKAVKAFFNTEEKANKAQQELQNKGFNAKLQKGDHGVESPDLDTSMMMGFPPNSAHALYQTRWLDSEGVYLSVNLQEDQNENDAKSIIKEFDGQLR